MSELKHRSQLCAVIMHEFCGGDRCDCECHSEWTGLGSFTDFQYDCWKSRVSERVTHDEGTPFTPWWDIAAMWLANKHPNMTVREQQVYVDAAWVAINKSYWSLDEAKDELARRRDLA